MSPLIARPFLRRKCVMVVNYTTIIDEWPYANSTSGIDNSTQIYHTQEEMHRDTHVRWAYWIVALLHVSINEFIGILATESNTPCCQQSLSFTSLKLTYSRKKTLLKLMALDLFEHALLLRPSSRAFCPAGSVNYDIGLSVNGLTRSQNNSLTKENRIDPSSSSGCGVQPRCNLNGLTRVMQGNLYSSSSIRKKTRLWRLCSQADSKIASCNYTGLTT